MAEGKVFGFRDWEPFEYGIPGTDAVVTAEVRRPLRFEQAGILRARAKVAGRVDKVRDLRAADAPFEEILAAEANLLEGIPNEDIETWFRSSVRNVRGIEENGTPIATGEELGRVADGMLVVTLILALGRMAGLNGREAKTSASPSTSPQAAPRTADGESDATSIASGAGATPSTAEPIPSDGQ